MTELNKKTLRNVFLGVVGCIFLYWLLHETEQVGHIVSVISGIFSPFVLGAALAFILNVPMRAFEGLLKKLQNTKLRRLLSVVLTFIAVLLVLALVFWLLIPQVIETVSSLVPSLQRFFVELGANIEKFLADNPELMEWVTANTDLEKLNWSELVQKAVTTVGNSLSTILLGTFSVIGTVTGAIVDLVIALVFAIYCLFQKETLARQGRRLLYAFAPERFSDHVVRILRLSNATFSNFLSGQCIEVCILGALFAVSMAIFRMPYIPLVSVLVAVTAFIPVVGAFVGCIVGAFLMLVNDPLQAVGFVCMFLVLQQIENNLIYPRVVGTSIGLSGMWVLLAVAVGGELMGVAGMFLMIPFASVLYTLLREMAGKRLAKLGIDPTKLTYQPQQMRSRFSERKSRRNEKRAQDKAESNND